MAGCPTTSSSDPLLLKCSGGGRTSHYPNCGTTAASPCSASPACARGGPKTTQTQIADYDPDMGALINRDADNWRPLFTIAEMVGADWPERIRDAAAALAPRESESTGPMLLGDIKAMFDEKQSTAWRRSKSVSANGDGGAALGRMEGSKGSSPKPLTPNQLARLLKPFGIAPTGTIRVGNRTAKGYYRHQFTEAWDRYRAEGAEGVNQPSQRHNATATGTSATSQPSQADPDVTVEKCEKPLGPNDCDGVTVGNGGNGHSRAREPIGIDQPGLSWRAIDQLARETEDWAYARRDQGDIGQDELEAEIRRQLTVAGIFPEAIEIEIERVMQCLFEGRRGHTDGRKRRRPWRNSSRQLTTCSHSLWLLLTTTSAVTSPS